MNNLIVAVWLLLGAGVANMAPVFASKIPLIKNWNYRLDFGLNFRQKPFFGKNKTWRGLISGIILAILVVAFQQFLLNLLDKDILIGGKNFTEYSALILGTLLGAGALIGDAVESLLKRQMDIAPGKSWFPFDQVDYIIGAIIFTYAVAPLTTLQYILMIFTGFGLHVLLAYIGYLLKLKSTPI